MLKIWKYIVDETLEIPKGGKIVHVDIQNHIVCIWVLVDPEAHKVKRHFGVVGTGWEITGPEGDPVYVGTVLDGVFVWHIIEYRQ